MASSSHATRTSSKVFLIGDSRSTLPQFQLPTNGDVLRCVAWERQKPGNLKIPLFTLVSCPLKSESKSTICSLTGGCQEKENVEDRCILAKIKRRWDEAGIKTVQEFSIRKKICDLSDEFTKTIKKKEKLQTPGAIAQREAFKDKLNKCLDVSAADAEDEIKADRKRTDKDRDEDLKFLNRDQLSDRKMFCPLLVSVTAIMTRRWKIRGRERKKRRSRGQES